MGPSDEDCNVMKQMRDGEQPNVATHPYTFAWYSLCTKFQDCITSTWKAAPAPKAGGKGKGKAAAPKKEAPKPKVEEKKPAEDEMDDLFGDEDEEAAAEARDHAAMLRGKAFEAKKKAANEAAGKVAPEAKSLILWEVKPVDDETDLDALAKRILAITNEKGGLFWKTEYKKAPIAFGIFKLIIGATIHDNLVSTDDVQEQIEAMEDMVQSVDIQSFNKL